MPYTCCVFQLTAIKPSPVYTLSVAPLARTRNGRRHRCCLAERRRRKRWTDSTSASMKINHRCHQLRRAALHNGSLTVGGMGREPRACRTAPHNDNENDMETKSNLERAGKQWSASVVAVGGPRHHDVDQRIFIYTANWQCACDRPPSCLHPPTSVATGTGRRIIFMVSSDLPPYCCCTTNSGVDTVEERASLLSLFGRVTRIENIWSEELADLLIRRT